MATATIGLAIILGILVLCAFFYSLGWKHGDADRKKQFEETFDFEWVDVPDED